MNISTTELVKLIAAFFDAAGLILVGWGAVVALVKLLKTEVSLFAKRDHYLERAYDKLREDFGYRMVLGLEFFLAGDLIRLIVVPSFEGLVRIAAIVAVRTVLAAFLTWEVRRR